MDSRFDRQIALFGKEGQHKVEASRVAIIGLGGLGSHLAQQLAYLGVKSFELVDPDTVDLTNLNRLIGSYEPDVGLPKVDTAKRLIRSISPNAEVNALQSSFTEWAANNPGVIDVLFGSVDNDSVRLTLLSFCAEQGVPYLDLASDVNDEYGLEYGGRVFFNFLGGCLSCKDELDQRQIRRASMTPDQLKVDDEIYGVPRSMLGDTGPSVVSINGVVASLAITEFMVWRTGLRAPKRYLNYRATRGGVTSSPDEEDRSPNCFYCGRYARTSS